MPDPTPEQIERWERRYEAERANAQFRAELNTFLTGVGKAVEGIVQTIANGMQSIADAHAADQRRIRQRQALENAAYATWKREREARP